MGNVESNVSSGVKKQADSSLTEIYQLVDLKGGGILIDVMKKAIRTRDFSEIDSLIHKKVEHFLYNHGNGKLIPISFLIQLRNREKPKHKQIFETNEQLLKCEIYKEVCWNIENRGAVGETILHLCLLNTSSVHDELAKRLLYHYPKLINDIYLNDEYYGENVLHLAVVNEDPSMVKYLLDCGVNYNERCFGSFMSAEDQKVSRSDSLDHEWLDVNLNTNYEGYFYLGEYALSFAACLEQKVCFKLILQKGANIDSQDTNGNTVLHMLVIHDKIEMFDIAYKFGADLSIKNKLGLTPLTLAAYLAKLTAFMHILDLERDSFWQIGNLLYVVFPLDEIDTINNHNGNINRNSALNLIIFGEKDDHLELIDGLLVDLLYKKWTTYIKYHFYKKFCYFSFYFLISLTYHVLNTNITHSSESNITELDFSNESMKIIKNKKEEYKFNNNFEWIFLYGFVLRFLEYILIIIAFLYIYVAFRQFKNLGNELFIQNLITTPSRILFLLSCFLTISTFIGQIYNYVNTANHILIMLTTAPYFLYFCRAFQNVGPFVIMIYRMIVGDLLRFVSIYLVFVIGFSQSFYLITSHEETFGNETDVNYVFKDILESTVTTFLMSLNDFIDYYEELDKSYFATESKILFILFMVTVAILLINMLIAMMGSTYQKITETKNERIRQWGRIILAIEREIESKERLKNFRNYTVEMSDGRRGFLSKRNQSEEQIRNNQKILKIKDSRKKFLNKTK